MNVIIEGYDKPKSCRTCPFNRDDCWCSITHGEIDRDYYDCDKPCPIKPLPATGNEFFNFDAPIIKKQTATEEGE